MKSLVLCLLCFCSYASAQDDQIETFFKEPFHKLNVGDNWRKIPTFDEGGPKQEFFRHVAYDDVFLSVREGNLVREFTLGEAKHFMIVSVLEEGLRRSKETCDIFVEEEGIEEILGSSEEIKPTSGFNVKAFQRVKLQDKELLQVTFSQHMNETYIYTNDKAFSVYGKREGQCYLLLLGDRLYVFKFTTTSELSDELKSMFIETLKKLKL